MTDELLYNVDYGIIIIGLFIALIAALEIGGRLAARRAPCLMTWANRKVRAAVGSHLRNGKSFFDKICDCFERCAPSQ
jgi:hypothetical protein